MEKMSHVHRRMALKALKIAVGSCIAIVLAELLQLQYATSAGIVTLLTVQNTKKDTLRLAADRFWSFLLSIGLIFICLHIPGAGWIGFGVYLLLMVVSCSFLDWQGTISVNAVMGTHYMMSRDYSLSFVAGEFLLILIGTAVALALNWKMPSNQKKIREDILRIEDSMQQVLRELAGYLSGDHDSSPIWFDLDKLEEHLHLGLERAHEQAGNTMSEADLYYIEYMEMRMQQCAMLQTLRSRVQRMRGMPKQAKVVSQYLEYLARYVHEENIPDKQIEKLQQVFGQMKLEELPKDREEFENRAILYHVLMDLEEFLFVKQRFVESFVRPQEL